MEDSAMKNPIIKGSVLLVGISTRALAQSAVTAGWQVVSVDFFGDSDQPAEACALSLVRDLGQPPELGRLAAAALPLLQDVDAVVVETGLENEPALFKVAHNRNTWNNSPQSVAHARDLQRLYPLLMKAGMQFPATVFDDRDIPPSGRFLVKNGKHSGGMGVREWDGSTLLGVGDILQEYIDGDLASACFLADGKQAMLLGMTRQYAGVTELGAPPFAWCGNVAPFIQPSMQTIIHRAVDSITAACGLTGLNGIDFLIRDGRPVFLEVNPRPPASFELFERLLGINAFQLHVDACQGKLPPRIPEFHTGIAWGKGILYANLDLTVGDTSDWHKRSIADIPHPGEAIPAGAPVCTLFAQSDDLERCWHTIQARATALYAELTQNH